MDTQITQLEKRVQEYKTGPIIENEEQALENIDSMFIFTPPGAFEWEQTVPGDTHVYACGDADCPVGWHLSFYTVTLGRNEDGNRFFDVYEGDEDGNWDIAFGWKEGEPALKPVRELVGLTALWFRCWAEYELEYLRTGKDPVNHFAGKPTREEVIDSIQKLIKN